MQTMSKRTWGALFAAAMLAAAPSADAQSGKAAAKRTPPFQAGRPTLTVRPAGDAAVIKTMADAMGFVRGAPFEVTDTINRVQWNAAGTLTGPSGPMKVRYTYGLSLSLGAAREDIRPASGPRLVRVVHGDKAWNETAPGIGGTWANDQAKARRLQLARTPFGFTKAVLKAPAGSVRVTDPGPGGVVTVSLSIEGVPTTATLDEDYRPRTVSMTVDGRRYEATYTDYRDLSEYGLMFPVRTVEKIDNRVVADLTTSDTRVSNYLIFPPPGGQ
jgi:hypothetical protein